MNNLFTCLLNDETGFIISSELVLVATIGVLSLVVGLSEISHGVNQELEDVGSAFGALQQSYVYNGLVSYDKAELAGSFFEDERDHCDSQYDIAATGAVEEGDYYGHYDY